MKKIVILLIIMSTTFVNAQIKYDKWDDVELTDSFGDKTGDKIKAIYLKGKFSNSATENSDLEVIIADYGDFIQIRLFEYNNMPEAKLAHDSNVW